MQQKTEILFSYEKTDMTNTQYGIRKRKNQNNNELLLFEQIRMVQKIKERVQMVMGGKRWIGKHQK